MMTAAAMEEEEEDGDGVWSHELSHHAARMLMLMLMMVLVLVHLVLVVPMVVGSCRPNSHFDCH